MKHEVRAMVAYVVSRLVCGGESSFVFDASGLGHRSMAGTVSEKCVNVYDYTARCHLTGTSSGGWFALYHHGAKAHMTLRLTGESFRGFDHGEGRGFHGVVRGPRVLLLDQAENRGFSFWCEAAVFSRMPEQKMEEPAAD